MLRINRGSAISLQPLAVSRPTIGAKCISTLSGPVRRDRAIEIAVPFRPSDQGNKYLLIDIDYITKRPEGYAVPEQEVSALTEALVT
jgi:hypothetical protein